MSLFKLGLLKGVASTYTQIKQAEAAEEAQIRAEERAATQRAKEAADAFARQKELNELQFQNQKLITGRQELFALQREERGYEQQTAMTEMQQNFQFDFAREQQVIKTEAETKQRERDIIQTFGYVEDKDTGEQRLPNAAEMAQKVSNAAKNGQPMVIPQSLGTVYGFSEAIKAEAEFNKASTFTGGVGVPVDTDNPIFSYQVGDQVKTVFGVNPKDGTSSDRAKTGALAVVAQIAPDFNLLKQQWNSGPSGRGPGTFYAKVKSALGGYGASSFLDAYTVGKVRDDGSRLIQDPLATLNLENVIPNVADREWFLNEFVRPATGLGMNTLKRLAGIPLQLGLSRDAIRQDLVLPRKEDYQWALDVSNPDSPKIKDRIWNQVTEVSKYSGVPEQVVLATYAGFGENAEKALAMAKQDRGLIRTSITEDANGKVRFAGNGKNDVKRIFDERGLTSTKERVDYVRQNLAATASKKPTRVFIGPQGQEKAIYGDRESTYGIDQNSAREQAVSARQVVTIAQRLKYLQENDLASPGIEGTAINIIGGLDQIARSLMEMGKTYNMSEKARARFKENSEKLNGFLGMAPQSKIEGQAVYNLLAEQLAFAMAAAFQKGEGGRAISDRDVEAQRSVLGLRSIFANELGALKNLDYLIEEFDRVAEINMAYGEATDSLTFKATYIVDNAGTRARSITDILNSDKIVRFDEDEVNVDSLREQRFQQVPLGNGNFMTVEVAQ